MFIPKLHNSIGPNTQSKSVLVTGGAGYIGSHAAKALSNAGYQPIVLDDLSTGNANAVKWGPLIEGNCGDRKLVADVIEKFQISSVMHFAASSYVGESMKAPQKYFANNVVNSLNLFQELLEQHVNYVVFSSSCATYGSPSHVPVTEKHAQTPISPYGESKLFIERVLKWYGSTFDTRWVALRYFNAAGADADADLCEEHEPETHLIPLAIRAAMGRIDHFDLYGTDYPTPDGTAIRDFVHVSDLADAHVLALGHLLSGGESMAANLGSGGGTSVLEVLEKVSLTCGKPVPTRNLARRPGDPPALFADSSLAEQKLRWKPRHSDLSNIIATALRRY